jgi:hypothetical protein
VTAGERQSRSEAEAWVRDSCLKQGISPIVEDPTVLRRVAQMMRDALPLTPAGNMGRHHAAGAGRNKKGAADATGSPP